MSFFQRLAARGSAASASRARKDAYDNYLRDYYHYGPRQDDDTMYILNKYAANTKRYGAPVAKQAARQLSRQGSSFASARSSLSRQSSGALSRQSSGALSRQSSTGSSRPQSMHGVRYSQSRKKWVWDDDSRQAALESAKPKTHSRR